MAAQHPLVLTILDGWGFSPAVEGNAIALARKPNYDALLREYPNTLVRTSGPSVGLPEGQMGNSEVGHLNIGAGRIIQMDVTQIDQMISTGEIFDDPVLVEAMKRARGKRLHLMGLCSDGGVHSLLTHLYALLEMAHRFELNDVCVHCFLDGRDTPPHSGAGFIEELQKVLREKHVGRIATVSGRYYAMDRDKRWERVERAFDALRFGGGEKTADPVAAIRQSYEKGVTDEFFEPVTVVDARNEPVGLIRDDDVSIFFNYRADRGREMTMALSGDVTVPYHGKAPRGLHHVTMTEYDKTFHCPFVLAREHPHNILANVMGGLNWKNLRVAETEKYAHVTYFFNGGNEKPYPGESRELVASPKVATYDLKPEMSAAGITEVVVKAIEKGGMDVVVMNFANADMVGHSGKLDPTVRAVETVDGCLGEIHMALKRHGGTWLITADHGNAETMIDPVTKGPHTYHTTNPVPLIVVDEARRPLKANGSLRDIAPTILGMMGVPQPNEMSGMDLRSV